MRFNVNRACRTSRRHLQIEVLPKSEWNTSGTKIKHNTPTLRWQRHGSRRNRNVCDRNGSTRIILERPRDGRVRRGIDADFLDVEPMIRRLDRQDTALVIGGRKHEQITILAGFLELPVEVVACTHVSSF